MTSSELRQKYLDFFASKGHKIIPSASLVPENDPTVLFTTAGMHPLIPYLLGQTHPQGQRLTDVQKCLRTDDIDEVGDAFHHTFFEMLGNWSLGDYFKKETIEMSYEFLGQVLKIDMARLYITCFAGDKDAPKDEESAAIWESLGISKDHIFFLGKKENWWGPVGNTGPCGPDTEMHYDVTQVSCGPDCRPGCSCGRFSEIWNDVFLQYNKTVAGTFEKLPQPNVDTGMGLERTLAVVNGDNDDYVTDLWLPPVAKLESLSGLKYSDNKFDFRVVVDHLRAAIFAMADGVVPSNKERGYIVRRLIRRAVLKMKHLGISNYKKSVTDLSSQIIELMSPIYLDLSEQQEKLITAILDEVSRFTQTLEKGLKEFEKIPEITGKEAFNLFQTHGFPLELTMELAHERGQNLSTEEFRKEFEKHKELSRTSMAGVFKSGLADNSGQVTKYHTATHLLQAALRQVLGQEVNQKGSNITSERLRFDFLYPQKVDPVDLVKVEEIVNQKINERLPVKFSVMSASEARKLGATLLFEAKYGDQVKVYEIGDFSVEACTGPHVANTSELGHFQIIKEEAVSSGVRRIKAILS